MKLYIPRIRWVGGFGDYFKNAFESNGIEVFYSQQKELPLSFIHSTRLDSISFIKRAEKKRQIEDLNKRVLDECLSFMPDVFFIFNESRLTPHTIQAIKNGCKCLMVNMVGDDPWDSIRWVADYPHSLKYFDLIITGDPVWNNNIRKVSPKARIFWDCGGYDDKLFNPVMDHEVSPQDKVLFGCQLAFTGSSYGEKAEGAYRSDILSYLHTYDLRIWGGDQWGYRFKFNPELKKCYRGERLTYAELRKLYSLSDIFINLPAPQITYGFQPRVFEIAGCKGFQIVDNRMLLKYLFRDDEIVAFDTMGELIDKIDYFLNHETERKLFAERLYQRVCNRFTWTQWARRIIAIIDKGIGIEDLDNIINRGRGGNLADMLQEYTRIDD